MRAILCLALLLALSACVGARDGRRPPSRPSQASGASESPAELRQCLADLGRTGARYTVLRDQHFAGGCSATGAVQLNAIGIPIANVTAIKCRTAERLTRWVSDAVQSAAQVWLGTAVVRIDSFGSYSCRSVNSRPGARMSQHSYANAIDIAAFVLADGRRITVKDDWRSGDARTRTFLRTVFQAGCRRFNIAIGPDGDGFHQDHFHFDMGPNGPYCR